MAGADNVLAWQTGYPFSVNLSRGYPRYNPGEFSANDMLERGEPDVCLFVGSFGAARFTPEAQRRSRHIPTIVLDPPTGRGEIPATVRFTTSVYGIHQPGPPIAWTRCPFRCGPRCRPLPDRRGRAAGDRASELSLVLNQTSRVLERRKQAGPDGGGEGGAEGRLLAMPRETQGKLERVADAVAKDGILAERVAGRHDATMRPVFRDGHVPQTVGQRAGHPFQHGPREVAWRHVLRRHAGKSSALRRIGPAAGKMRIAHESVTARWNGRSESIERFVSRLVGLESEHVASKSGGRNSPGSDNSNLPPGPRSRGGCAA